MHSPLGRQYSEYKVVSLRKQYLGRHKLEKEQVANLDQHNMKLSNQFLIFTIAMAALAVSQAKLGGSGKRHLASGQCTICSKDNKTKPDYLTIKYVPQGVDSQYQESKYASCDEGSYPTSTTIEVTNKDRDTQVFDVQAGSIFTIKGPFNANTEFFFGDGSDCTIHTSCSVPLMAEDQIGPFVILEGNECMSPSAQPSPSPSSQPSETPSTPPTPAPSRSPSSRPTGIPSNHPSSQPTETPSTTPTRSPFFDQIATLPPQVEPCEICSKDNKNKPDKLTIEYVPQGVNSQYQDFSHASCYGRSYPTNATLTVPPSDKDGDAQVFVLEAGSVFRVNGPFDAKTKFSFADGFECFIHTSCSVPLVAGDQIGPFKMLGGNECNSGGITTLPPQDIATLPPQADPCEICSKDNKNKPDKLTVMYKSNGKTSDYQDSKFATCMERIYPTNTTIVTTTKHGRQEIPVEDGKVFDIYGEFNAATGFIFGDGYDCFFHTSCSVPLVAGDQIGPFVILEGNECKYETPSPSTQPSPPPSTQPTSTPSTPPTPAPSRSPSSQSTSIPSNYPSSQPTGSPSTHPTRSSFFDQIATLPPQVEPCEICSKDNKNKPDKLTFMYKSDGKTSDYQDSKFATCRERTYPTNTIIVTTTKHGRQEIPVADGSHFEIIGQFDAATGFIFGDGYDCFIHTSCSVPLVAGDQIGPFVVVAGNECNLEIA